MRTTRTVGKAIEVVGIAIVVLLIVGQVAGQPVLLGFVSTGSMAPTLDANDGFVAVPSALAGPPEPGDVVVYRAEEIQGGGLTTHRVVDRTDRGYVTRGDANAITDQASGEPPVRREQVVAEVLRLNGEVVAIPALGAGVTLVRSLVTDVQRAVAAALGADFLTGTTGFLYLVAGAAISAVAVDAWVGTSGKTRSRDRSRAVSRLRDSRVLVGGCALLLLIGLAVPMVVPAGTEQVDIVSAHSPSERATVIEAGESSTMTLAVENSGVLPMLVYLEGGSGVDVGRQTVFLPPRASADVSVTLHAPDSTGAYRRFITTHRYLALLPRSVIDVLYGFGPWVPTGTILGIVVGPFYLASLALVGRGRVRTRSRDGPSALDRLLSRFG